MKLYRTTWIELTKNLGRDWEW